MEDRKYIFGNQTFVNKLGVLRNEEGLISLRDLRSTIIKEDDETRRMAKHFTKAVNDIYTGKKFTVKDVLVKHRHKDTLKEKYYSHTLEVESKNPDGTVKVVGGFMRDVTLTIANQKKILHLANNDILTGVRNRNYFDAFVKSDLLPSSYCVMLFDLDGLKLINDAFGHLEGDKAIKLVIDFIVDIFTDNLLIARIGGDEFVVITSETDSVIITNLANELENRIADYNKTSMLEVNVSKGGYVVEDNAVTFERAFIHAENLMYRRKLGNRSSRKSKVLDSILETLVAKTEETKEHSDRMAVMCVDVMKELKMFRASEIEDMRLLAKVHDVGKITIPDYILNKPGKLTPSEFDVIKKHSEAGYKIIKNITDSDFVSEAVLGHHEKWDGTGYPQGLKGEDIPMFARILSVADSYDAMTSNRIYNKIKTKEEAINEIKRCTGTQFDPKVVEAFLKVMQD
jgi:diguanylate cyclase (GGDEF)-like protein